MYNDEIDDDKNTEYVRNIIEEKEELNKLPKTDQRYHITSKDVDSESDFVGNPKNNDPN
jgi:hypothetical protein